MLPEINKHIREGTPVPLELWREMLCAPKASVELQLQADEWAHAQALGWRLYPLDTYIRGCIARDIQDAKGIKGTWSGIGQDELDDDEVPF